MFTREISLNSAPFPPSICFKVKHSKTINWAAVRVAHGARAGMGGGLEGLLSGMGGGGMGNSGMSEAQMRNMARAMESTDKVEAAPHATAAAAAAAEIVEDDGIIAE